MAIQKIKSRKFEFSRATIIQLSCSGVILVISLVLGWLAFARWWYKDNLLKGFWGYHSNQPQIAKTSLEAALYWKKDSVPARLLLAKINCDANQLNAAEKSYQGLPGRVDAHVGLGVIWLKRADKAVKPEEVNTMVGQARAAFIAGKGLSSTAPEPQIGLGHCELMLAQKLNDPSRLAVAQGIFDKVTQDLTRPEVRLAVTKSGLIDYYTGLGKARSAGGRYDPEAARAMRACYQYARQLPVPIANRLYMEAIEFSQANYSNETLMKRKMDIQYFRREMREPWQQNAVLYAPVKEAWLQFSLTVAKAFADAGNMSEYDTMVYEIIRGSGFEQRLDPLLFDIGVRVNLALRDDVPLPTQLDRVNRAAGVCRELLRSDVLKQDANKAILATMYNVGAWLESFLAAVTRNDAMYRTAEDHLQNAILLAADRYEFHRNLALTRKRLKRPEKDLDQALEKARALKTAAEEEDFTAVEEFCKGKR